MTDRLLGWLLVHGVPRFIAGERRTAFVSGWVGMSCALWLCWGALAVIHHFGAAAWIGVVAIAPCIGWLASLLLHPLRPKLDP